MHFPISHLSNQQTRFQTQFDNFALKEVWGDAQLTTVVVLHWRFSRVRVMMVIFELLCWYAFYVGSWEAELVKTHSATSALYHLYKHMQLKHIINVSCLSDFYFTVDIVRCKYSFVSVIINFVVSFQTFSIYRKHPTNTVLIDVLRNIQ